MLTYDKRPEGHETVFFHYDIAMSNTTQNVWQAIVHYSHSQSSN
jgi:hypothetical protein